jgi:alpha-D-ribose 1-methylphosphonate 5-triphosphate synthase subunit PhnI
LRSPDPNNPANSQEFVLYHTEVIESYGFVNHLKLPHYVTFQAGLQELREILKTNHTTNDNSEVPVTAGETGGEDDDD